MYIRFLEIQSLVAVRNMNQKGTIWKKGNNTNKWDYYTLNNIASQSSKKFNITNKDKKVPLKW